MAQQRLGFGLQPGDDTRPGGAPVAELFRMVRGTPPKPFREAVRPIETADPEIIPRFGFWADRMLEDARSLKDGRLRDCPLNVEEVAAVKGYSSQDTKPPLYQTMNDRCYEPSRQRARVFVEYMWLLFCALSRLPPLPNCTVFRGVKMDSEEVKQALRTKYNRDAEGNLVVWHGFTSCTRQVGLMDQPDFCGTRGDRAIFVIHLTQGQARDISSVSSYAHEKEVLLPPGCCFEIQGVSENGEGQLWVHLHEVRGEWIQDINAGTGGAASSNPVAQILAGVSLLQEQIQAAEARAAAAEARATTAEAQRRAAETAAAASQERARALEATVAELRAAGQVAEAAAAAAREHAQGTATAAVAAAVSEQAPVSPEAPAVPVAAPGPVPLAQGSSLVTPAQLQALMQQLETVGVRQLRLLYKGTRDQFTAERFHQLCDNQGGTVTLCRSQQGHLFGGYTDVPWDSSNKYKESNAAFLFKLGQGEQLAFSRHNVVQDTQQAVYCSAVFGPRFGIQDMRVDLDGEGTARFRNFGTMYDRGPGHVVFLGEGYRCPLEEVEVFACLANVSEG